MFISQMVVSNRGKSKIKKARRALFYYLGISITSKSLNSPSSAVNLTSVRTVCHPCSPAAPGLMCKSFKDLSYSTFRICECPLMKSLGGRLLIKSRTLRSYAPGWPPMCFMSTSAPSHDQRSTSGYMRRKSPPSQFPHTARNGFRAARRSANSIVPMSPACHISSHSAKYSLYLSSQYPWVSDKRPIRFIV